MRWFASLKRQADFARVRRHGRRANLPTVRAFGAGRQMGEGRIGITVPGSVGNAVVRNLLRRRVQGALDALALGRIGADVVFVVGETAANAGYAVLAADVAEALRRVAGTAGPR